MIDLSRGKASQSINRLIDWLINQDPDLLRPLYSGHEGEHTHGTRIRTLEHPAKTIEKYTETRLSHAHLLFQHLFVAVYLSIFFL